MSQKPIIIKKYANRRLYNTAASVYVTLDDLSTMVRQGQDFVVRDAKTNEDLTRSVLTQIIVEEESKGQNLLPISFLKQLIGFYGDSLEVMVPKYLEASMQVFSNNQDKLRTYLQGTMNTFFPFNNLEKISKQNQDMFEKTVQMFNPFAGITPTSEQRDVAALQQQVNDMKAELERLRKKDS